MSQYQTVLYEVANRVATITLNRPSASNAFNAQMRRELIAAIEAASNDDGVRVAILTGAGRHFSAGADLTEEVSADFLPQFAIEDEFKPGILAITQAPKPFLAAINGAASGVASGYALACDMVLMAENACIHQAFSAIGLIPDGGATWQLINHLGSKRAYELIAMGERLSAERCVNLGLANRVVPTDVLLKEARALAEQLAQRAPLALRYAKQVLRKVMKMELDDAISYEAALQNRLVRSEDAKEGIRAFLEKRQPVFTGR
ncbi:enoyl-CoA hydratase/isomerase family protein [Pandoraea terrae]|nr:enoyl-CoA hydratase/isomerase family protein [Pandoraea terrae]